MNLLPKIEKEALKKSLKHRSIMVALFLAAAALLIGLVMLLPTYMMTLDFNNSISNNNLKVEDTAVIQQIINLPEEIDAKLKFFQSNLKDFSVTDYLYEIISGLPKGVVLDSISFTVNQNDGDKKGITILISGTATDRNALVSFSNFLKNSDIFSIVDVPVSSLTRDKNLPFSINIFIENIK